MIEFNTDQRIFNKFSGNNLFPYAHPPYSRSFANNLAGQCGGFPRIVNQLETMLAFESG